MNRIDGTSAHQLDLDLLDDPIDAPRFGRRQLETARPTLTLLRKDVYAELARRRRRAQIEARHLLDRD